MKIAIIAAMSKELKLLLSIMGDCTKREESGLELYEGKLSGHDIVLMQCGIGKVNSALLTLRMLETEYPDLVINSGVAGGVDSRMKIGSVLVADAVAYHDVWCGPGTQYGQADGYPLFFKPWQDGLDKLQEVVKSSPLQVNFGLLCSGDKFISRPEEVAQIKSEFADALGCDMESASIAQTCASQSVPFMIIRVMSDMPGSGENISEYQNFWNDAPSHNFQILKALLGSIPQKM